MLATSRALNYIRGLQWFTERFVQSKYFFSQPPLKLLRLKTCSIPKCRANKQRSAVEVCAATQSFLGKHASGWVLCSVCSNTDLTDWLLNAFKCCTYVLLELYYKLYYAYMYYWTLTSDEVSVPPTASPLWSLSWSLLALQTFMRNELLLGRIRQACISQGQTPSSWFACLTYMV